MRRLSFEESATPVVEGLYERLRRLAVEDPREAKKLFLATFEANSEELTEFLVRLKNRTKAAFVRLFPIQFERTLKKPESFRS